MSVRARLRPKAQLTLPEEIRRTLHVSEGDEIEFAVQENGIVTVRGYVSVPSDQAWYFTREGQVGRRRAEREIAARSGTVHGSAEAMFAYLDSLGAADVLQRDRFASRALRDACQSAGGCSGGEAQGPRVVARDVDLGHFYGSTAIKEHGAKRLAQRDPEYHSTLLHRGTLIDPGVSVPSAACPVAWISPSKVALTIYYLALVPNL